MDDALLTMINPGWSSPALDVLMSWASARWTFAFPLLFLLLWDARRRAGRQGLGLWLLLAVSIGIGDATGNVMKSWIAEPRPCFSHHEVLVDVGGGPLDRCEGGATKGMPSIHALNYFLAAAFLVMATTWRTWQVAVVIAALLASLSRIYLGKHLPSQVAAGALLGSALGMLAALVACYHPGCIRNSLGDRFFRRGSDG